MLTAGILLVSLTWKNELTLDEYREFYASPDYDCQYEKVIGGYKVQLKYRPTELHIASRVENKEERDSLIKENSSVAFFDMKITALSGVSPIFEGDQSVLEERVMYFLAHVTDDLMLHNDDGEYYLLNHHMERNYNINNSIYIQLAFNRPEHKDFTFTYNDRVLGIGKVNFEIKAKDIDKLPKINTL